MGQLLFQTTPPLEKSKSILDHTKKWIFPLADSRSTILAVFLPNT